MKGQNIICFAKDWSEDPTSCNHVLEELAKENRVLWINSISTRSPNLTNGRDMGKIVRKLASFFRGPKAAGERLWVYTPLVLPFHHNPRAVAINRVLLRTTLCLLRRKLGMGDFQLWTFVPTSAEYVGHLGESLLVYYCTDNWSKFRSMDGERVNSMVERLATQADVVFATSTPILERLSPFNKNAHLAAHGVDYELFSTALNVETEIPADLAALPGPVLGFYGLIEDWLDQGLIAYLAERHPDWSLALVGKTMVDISALARFTNVHFLGRKPHAVLPAYCKGFAVGLIPHHVNELTRHMNPIKLREYLCAGLPIVSTNLPEVKQYGEHCLIANDYAEFERGVQRAIQCDTPELRRRRSESMQIETWRSKVAALTGHIERAAQQN